MSEVILNKTTRRGYDADDERFFCDKEIEKLKTANYEVKWLLDRGYPIKSVVEFVGNHHLLSIRQRHALQRGTASNMQCKKRYKKLLEENEIEKNELFIDGFNLIITLEVALSQSYLIMGNDGVIRDLAGLRGTYSIIDKTDRAIEIIGKTLTDLKISKATFYLDSPVSNSGRLKSKINEVLLNWPFDVEIELVPNADPILSKLEGVVTSDSIILDNCKSWVNLSRIAIENYIRDARVIYLV